MVKKNLFWVTFIGILLYVSTAAPITGLAHAQSVITTAGPAAGGQQVKLFLIAIGDGGLSGKKIGCGDSVVAVTRELQAARTPLRAALKELLGMPERYGSGPELYNALHQAQLKLKSVSVRRGTARINFTGHVLTRGVCDSPRVQAQIEETARQFPSVKKVQVFINGVPLSEYLSERG